MIAATSPSPARSATPLRVLGASALLFGAVTILEGGHVLFGGPEARAARGNVVPFVLVFTFCAGFVYVATGCASLLRRTIAVPAARLLAISTLLVFAAFGVHVLLGGAYEVRTALALTLRSTFWVLQALLLPLWLRTRPS